MVCTATIGWPWYFEEQNFPHFECSVFMMGLRLCSQGRAPAHVTPPQCVMAEAHDGSSSHNRGIHFGRWVGGSARFFTERLPFLLFIKWIFPGEMLWNFLNILLLLTFAAFSTQFLPETILPCSPDALECVHLDLRTLSESSQAWKLSAFFRMEFYR